MPYNKTNGNLNKSFIKPAQYAPRGHTSNKEKKTSKLITDSRKEFKNINVENLSKKEGINHEINAPYYHEGNGRIE